MNDLFTTVRVMIGLAAPKELVSEVEAVDPQERAWAPLSEKKKELGSNQLELM
jgi:hypothetical protein